MRQIEYTGMAQYFTVELVLVISKQIETKDEVNKIIEECPLVLKLTPFKNQFRAKMLASLNGEESTEKAKLIGLTLNFNIKNLTLLNILDCRELQTLLDGAGNGNINTEASQTLTLTESEKLTSKSHLKNLPMAT